MAQSALLDSNVNLCNEACCYLYRSHRLSQGVFFEDFLTVLQFNAKDIHEFLSLQTNQQKAAAHVTSRTDSLACLCNSFSVMDTCCIYY